MSILINVSNQKMHVYSSLEELVSGSQEFVRFEFVFNKDWDNLTTFAQFTQNGIAYNQYLDENNGVYLPPEIKEGTCTLMLYGSRNTVIATTNYLTLKITKDILVSNVQSTEITESLYNQLVSRMDNFASEVSLYVDEVATREISDYLESGKLANLTIEDGSITPSKLSEDVLNLLSSGVVEFIPVTELPNDNIKNAIYLLPIKGGEQENLFEEYIYVDGKWELLGTTSVQVDLTDYVKNSDYATADKGGVVLIKDGSYSGICIKNGVLCLSGTGYAPLSNAHFDNPIAYSVPLTSNNIYKWFKAGLINNTETFINEEKVSANEWLGLTALAIPNTIEGGGKSISVNDVSPLAHTCSCRLTSDTYEETQSTGESNNIYDFNAENISIGMYMQDGIPSPVPYAINDNGTITFNGTTDPSGLLVGVRINFYNLIKGQTYTFSLRSNNQNETFDMHMFAANDWSIMTDREYLGQTTITYTFTATDVDGHHWCDITCLGGEQRPIENFIVYPQLEFGSEMTDWAPYGGGAGIVITKPYIEDFTTVRVNVGGKSYIPSADGTVTGVVSVSPIMEITTDNEHANIVDFTYCVDTKTYIDKSVNSIVNGNEVSY